MFEYLGRYYMKNKEGEYIEVLRQKENRFER